ERIGAFRVGCIFEKKTFPPGELAALAGGGVEIITHSVGDASAESGFKSAFELLNHHQRIDALILDGNRIAQGAIKAARMFADNGCTRLIGVKSGNWLEDEGVFDALIQVSNHAVGQLAAQQLLAMLLPGSGRGGVQTMQADFRILNDSPAENGTANQPQGKARKSGLRVALLNAKTAAALIPLSRVFSRRHGPRPEFVSYQYDELASLAANPAALAKAGIDVVMYDIAWLESLVKVDALLRLDELQADTGYFSDFIPDIVDAHTDGKGGLYGLPYLTGTQLLFYLRDLFEDESLARQFRRKHEYDLKVPDNWDEFNEIASFFTFATNEKSPVRYGTALINGGNIYNSIEYLNRLWPLGGVLYDNGSLLPQHQIAAAALDNYLAAFASSYRPCSSWDDIADVFKRGEVAMAVLYDSFAFGINDSMESRVAGNVGSAVIPGGCPVLGGWGLGIFSRTRKKSAALDFLRWACGSRIAEPFSVLSGISSRTPFYLNTDLDILYPWKSQVLESYALSRTRPSLVPDRADGSGIQLYRRIGEALGSAARGETSQKQALRDIRSLL
ncbi:MAG: extracellular solute-binding protein, partial [Planctomycetes bacterium]|nr:extracellular solute-binding protein [Planctomycetota bacterium]